MTVVTYGQDKVLNRDTGTLLREMRGNLCSKKWKHYIEIWRHFVLSDGLALYFDQFENVFNQCGRNITFLIIKLLQYFQPTLMFNIYHSWNLLVLLMMSLKELPLRRLPFKLKNSQTDLINIASMCSLLILNRIILLRSAKLNEWP